MSQSTQKKERRERKKAIQKYIKDNQDIVLEVVIENITESGFLTRFVFCWTILFKKAVK